LAYLEAKANSSLSEIVAVDVVPAGDGVPETTDAEVYRSDAKAPSSIALVRSQRTGVRPVAVFNDRTKRQQNQTADCLYSAPLVVGLIPHRNSLVEAAAGAAAGDVVDVAVLEAFAGSLA